MINQPVKHITTMKVTHTLPTTTTIILMTTTTMNTVHGCADFIVLIIIIAIMILSLLICTGIPMIPIITEYLFIIPTTGGDPTAIGVGATDHITIIMSGTDLTTTTGDGGIPMMDGTTDITTATGMVIIMDTGTDTTMDYTATATTITTATTSTHQTMYTTDLATI